MANQQEVFEAEAQWNTFYRRNIQMHLSDDSVISVFVMLGLLMQQNHQRRLMGDGRLSQLFTPDCKITVDNLLYCKTRLYCS